MAKRDPTDLIDSYYQQPAPGAEFATGQICDSLVYHLESGTPSVLKFDYDAANRGERVTYTIDAATAESFEHRPVAGLRPLQTTEALIPLVAKRRAVVVLSASHLRPAVPGLPKRDFAEAYLVAPLYSFRDNHPPEFRLRVKFWEYAAFFYLPDGDRFDVREGFLRYDRCLIVPQGLLKPRAVSLSKDATYVMSECFAWFLSGKLDETLSLYRADLLKILNDKLAKKDEST